VEAWLDPALPDRLTFHTSFARLTLSALTAVFLMLISGPLVADVGSIARCLGWPLYGAVSGAAEIGGRSRPCAARSELRLRS